MNPASLTTLTAAIRTFGATPTMPTPLRAAAIVPATWVPWSLVVGYHPVAERSGRPASVQLTESATSMLAARSGWSGSMPESRTPTRTLRVPSVTSTVRLAPTDSTALPPLATTSARKVETFEWAMTTPICGHDWTTTPPAALTAVSTRRVWPGLAIRALTT